MNKQQMIWKTLDYRYKIIMYNVIGQQELFKKGIKVIKNYKH